MKLSKRKINAILREQCISQNALARTIGVRPGTLSNALSGRRGVGRVILAGLLHQFPNESVASLTERG
ncbi:putative transcription regulator containing HTH domain [Candidatus Desulfosporosinus infrequens]|uniref:Putative transcription regulator containing HTH domain n=1 Tax=Candidatus Desulfosporosinus infrequens TaxID=2043169 RepID=A0A2U3JWQ9_9FIRM|nr:putative transcription regulator containing HTH domain [Candidatus Desulfosporosinus infrequens]